jgi:hypothetical protein
VDAVDDMLPLGPQLALLEATLLADLSECCRRLQVKCFHGNCVKFRENASFCEFYKYNGVKAFFVNLVLNFPKKFLIWPYEELFTIGETA